MCFVNNVWTIYAGLAHRHHVYCDMYCMEITHWIRITWSQWLDFFCQDSHKASPFSAARRWPLTHVTQTGSVPSDQQLNQSKWVKHVVLLSIHWLSGVHLLIYLILRDGWTQDCDSCSIVSHTAVLKPHRSAFYQCSAPTRAISSMISHVINYLNFMQVGLLCNEAI